jgi:hypothetical protein
MVLPILLPVVQVLLKWKVMRMQQWLRLWPCSMWWYKSGRIIDIIIQPISWLSRLYLSHITTTIVRVNDERWCWSEWLVRQLNDVSVWLASRPPSVIIPLPENGTGAVTDAVQQQALPSTRGWFLVVGIYATSVRPIDGRWSMIDDRWPMMVAHVEFGCSCAY